MYHCYILCSRYWYTPESAVVMYALIAHYNSFMKFQLILLTGCYAIIIMASLVKRCM